MSDELADGREDARQPTDRDPAGRQQEGSGGGARGHLPRGEQVRAGERPHVPGDERQDGPVRGGGLPQVQ